MKEVKINEYGYAKIEYEKGKYLSVTKIDGKYNLLHRNYTEKYLIATWIKEDVKRLSTINKYSEKYGIKFC